MPPRPQRHPLGFRLPRGEPGLQHMAQKGRHQHEEHQKGGQEVPRLQPMMRIMPTGVLVMYMAVAAPAM